jgi:hypothetical protein
MAQIRNLASVILAALMLAGAAGDPAPGPDQARRADDSLT